jgi:hypothetical protein
MYAITKIDTFNNANFLTSRLAYKWINKSSLWFSLKVTWTESFIIPGVECVREK